MLGASSLHHRTPRLGPKAFSQLCWPSYELLLSCFFLVLLFLSILIINDKDNNYHKFLLLL